MNGNTVQMRRPREIELIQFEIPVRFKRLQEPPLLLPTSLEKLKQGSFSGTYTGDLEHRKDPTVEYFGESASGKSEFEKLSLVFLFLFNLLN
jgi:hypothetical protein